MATSNRSVSPKRDEGCPRYREKEKRTVPLLRRRKEAIMRRVVLTSSVFNNECNDAFYTCRLFRMEGDSIWEELPL
jgi:hypothetical protein